MRKNKNAKNKGKGPLRLQSTDDAEQQLETNRLSLRQQQELTPEGSGSALARYSENRSSDRFSGAFFEGANGVDISGGTFEQTHGHRNNVTIHLNVNSSSPGQDSGGPSQQPRPSSSHSSTSSHSGSSIFTSPPVYGQSTSSSLQDLPPKTNNEIYKEQLLLQKRGIPLWIPEPNVDLPKSYRRIGVALGDVGIYTPSGDFSFLFNICLPRNDPIQPDDLPESFSPIYPPIRERESPKFSELKPGSHLNSRNFKTAKSYHASTGLTCLTFESTATEGAILTLPEGADTYVVENLPRIRAYVAANIKNWYRYINGPLRGREVKNGEVRVVIRCDKATSWGMAIVSSPEQHKLHTLNYQPVEDDTNVPSPFPLYRWDYSGYVEGRVGPELKEIKELRDTDPESMVTHGKYSNQCLFVQTLNATLNDNVFASITQELQSVLNEQPSSLDTNWDSSNASPSNIDECQSSTNQDALGMNFGTQRISEPQIPDDLTRFVTLSVSPIATQISHPADMLNKLIFEMAASCEVVITEDEIWCSAINEGDEIMPNAVTLADRVLSAYRIKEKNGIAVLEQKLASGVRIPDTVDLPSSSTSPSNYNEGESDANKEKRSHGPLYFYTINAVNISSQYPVIPANSVSTITSYLDNVVDSNPSHSKDDAQHQIASTLSMLSPHTMNTQTSKRDPREATSERYKDKSSGPSPYLPQSEQYDPSVANGLTPERQISKGEWGDNSQDSAGRPRLRREREDRRQSEASGQDSEEEGDEDVPKGYPINQHRSRTSTLPTSTSSSWTGKEDGFTYGSPSTTNDPNYTGWPFNSSEVPPFTGYVETTVNALRLIHAARQGVIPRITRRLNDLERRTMIKSGAVFVFSVEESGIEHWTDGLLWAPSRIVGNFLVYREINERTSRRSSHKKPYPGDDSPTRPLIRKSSPDQISIGFKGHGADRGIFKVGGLFKKTITATIEGSDFHLISYYTSEDIQSGKLKRPTTRMDIMALYMPPHIFRLTNFRVPPKVEMGPDGKPRLVEAEEADSVDCKVEDHSYNILGSPRWSSQGSPTSPIENPFSGSSIYSVVNSNNQTNGSSGGYRTLQTSERWSNQGESLLSPLQRQDVGWGSASSNLSSSHTMGRRRKGSIVQSEQWAPIHSQSNRWQGSSHDSSVSSSTSSNSGMYQDRPRLRPVSPHDSSVSSSTSNNSGMYQDRPRLRPVQQYDGGHTAPARRDADGSQSYRIHYPLHPTATREGALQRLHWSTRDATDSSRDLRRSSQSTSFSPSPTLPFTQQGYHAPATYTSSWTPPVNDMLPTPTLHAIPNVPNISYNTSYLSNPASIVSSPDEYADVEEYLDS